MSITIHHFYCVCRCNICFLSIKRPRHIQGYHCSCECHAVILIASHALLCSKTQLSFSPNMAKIIWDIEYDFVPPKMTMKCRNIFSWDIDKSKWKRLLLQYGNVICVIQDGRRAWIVLTTKRLFEIAGWYDLGKGRACMWAVSSCTLRVHCSPYWQKFRTFGPCAKIVYHLKR